MFFSLILESIPILFYLKSAKNYKIRILMWFLNKFLWTDEVASEEEFGSPAWMKYIYISSTFFLVRSQRTYLGRGNSQYKPGGFATLRSSVKCIYACLAANE